MSEPHVEQLDALCIGLYKSGWSVERIAEMICDYRKGLVNIVLDKKGITRGIIREAMFTDKEHYNMALETVRKVITASGV